MGAKEPLEKKEGALKGAVFFNSFVGVLGATRIVPAHRRIKTRDVSPVTFNHPKNGSCHCCPTPSLSSRLSSRPPQSPRTFFPLGTHGPRLPNQNLFLAALDSGDRLRGAAVLFCFEQRPLVAL